MEIFGHIMDSRFVGNGIFGFRIIFNYSSMNIHHNLEAIKAIAIENAKEHNCNYNIVLMNPSPDNTFDPFFGSTFEFVADSYFEKPRPNAIIIHKTDDLIFRESKKETRKIEIVGAGNFARTILHGDTPSPVILVDSKVNASETSIPSIDQNFLPYNIPEMINIDHDVFPVQRKGKTNYTAPKKKRKK